jgi:hypothetical protein
MYACAHVVLGIRRIDLCSRIVLYMYLPVPGILAFCIGEWIAWSLQPAAHGD